MPDVPRTYRICDLKTGEVIIATRCNLGEAWEIGRRFFTTHCVAIRPVRPEDAALDAEIIGVLDIGARQTHPSLDA